MRILNNFALLWLSLLVLGCSGGTPSTTTATSQPTPAETVASNDTTQTVDPMQDKGIGPVTSVTLGPIDDKLVAEGDTIFKAKCSACHKMDKRRVGPALRGITAKRTPEWIMNLILNPAEMLEKNAQAKALLAEYSTPMADQNITEPEARALLEYLRTKENPDEE
jgi:cytochrome c551/c552